MNFEGYKILKVLYTPVINFTWADMCNSFVFVSKFEKLEACMVIEKHNF